MEKFNGEFGRRMEFENSDAKRRDRAFAAACLQRRNLLVLNQRADELSRRVETLRRALQDRYGSLSWAVTSPLRLVNDEVSLHLQKIRRGQRAKPTRSLEEQFAWIADYELENSGPLAVDVSRVHFSDCGTGIQRVVRRITESAMQDESSGSLVPIDLRNGALHNLTGRLLGEKKPQSTPREVHRMSRLLMLDGSWDVYSEITPLFPRCREKGIEIITCVYDLIPVDFPETCKGDLSEVFTRWLHLAVCHSDAFVCISEATARRLEAYIKDHRNLLKRPVRIGWWPLGVDFASSENQFSSASGRHLVPPSPYCLAVGTLEPRKNHRFLIETFSRWWREVDFDGHLAIAGRMGWQTGELVERIKSHPEFGRRLWWFPEVSDEHLRELYIHSAAVLMPSVAEGFGLPVVEGARFNKPVVLSDIPVFREIVVEDGYFFTLGDEVSFRNAVLRALKPGAVPTQVRFVTWQDSARALIELITENKYQIQLA